MKKIFILSIIIAAAAFSSCTMMKDSGYLQKTRNSRLQVAERLQVNPNVPGPGVDGLVKIESHTITRSQDLVPLNTAFRMQPLQLPIVLKYKPASISSYGTKSIAKTDIKEEKLLDRNQIAIKNAATYNRPIPANINPSMSEDLRLCLIFLAGLVVFSILGFLVVHLSLLALISGILLFICLAGFLIFLGIYLYKKKQMKKSEHSGN